MRPGESETPSRDKQADRSGNAPRLFVARLLYERRANENRRANRRVREHRAPPGPEPRERINTCGFFARLPRVPLVSRIYTRTRSMHLHV